MTSIKNIRGLKIFHWKLFFIISNGVFTEFDLVSQFEIYEQLKLHMSGTLRHSMSHEFME